MSRIQQTAALIFASVVAHALVLFLINPLDWSPGDEGYYLAVARSIISHAGYSVAGEPTTYRTPGYPLFLAILLQLRDSPVFVFAAQSLLGLSVGLLTLVRVPIHGIWVALLIVTSPFLIIFEYRLYSEALFIPLLWAAFLLLAFPLRRRDPWTAGLFLGVAILTRDSLLLLPLALVALGVVQRDILKPALIATAVAALVILPWPLRNASLPAGSFSMGNGRAGFNLWVGTWERNIDWARPSVANPTFPHYAFRDIAERQRLLVALQAGDDSAFKDAAVSRIRTNFPFVLKSWASRYWRLWSGTRSDAKFRAAVGSLPWYVAKAVLLALNLLTLALGLVGMALNWRRPLMALPVVYIALVHIPFHNVEARYSLPAVPFLYFFAVTAMAMAWPRLAPMIRHRSARLDRADESGPVQG